LISIDADTSSFRREVAEADKLAKGLGRSLTGAFSAAVVRGRDFGSVLESLAMRLSTLALRAAFKPIEQGFSSLFGSLLSGISPFAKSGFDGSNSTGFAHGGVVASPTFFPLGPDRLGLMGERGAEAILPLARGAAGLLGVRADAQAKSMNVTVRRDAGRRELPPLEAYLSSVIARAVARGERSL
jgi:phage-related minor tail protein